MKRFETFYIFLPVVLLCLISGCRSVPPSDVSFKPFVIDPSFNQMASLDLKGTNTISIRNAIIHALRTDADINERAARCHRAAGDLVGIHPESPEIRVGYERNHDNRRGWSSQQEWGNSSQNGEQSSTGSGDQTTARNQTSITDYSNPLTPDQTATENSTRQESSRSSESETSRSDSSFSKNASTVDYQRQQEDGVNVALRIRPPNPWILSAERQAGKAAKTIAEAELLVREHQLTCDIVETSLKLHYQKSMLKLQTEFVNSASRLNEKLRTAFEKGGLPSNDYADGCRVMSGALAKQHRMETEIVDLERNLRQLIGVSPSRLALDELRNISIIPLSVPKDQADDAAWASTLTASHAVVLRSQWTLYLMEAEWKKAKAANIPWTTRLIAGYAWWDGTRYGYGSFERSGSEHQTITSQSTRSETDTSRTQGTESEAPSGDVTTRNETAQQSSASQTDKTETQSEKSSSAGTETSNAENDGNEWWVEVGVEIPLFEWFSGESRIRRQAAKSAREACERVQQRVHSHIISALDAMRQTRDALNQSRLRFYREFPDLNHFISAARQQGLSGELKALRLSEEVIEMAKLFLDCSLREALARSELVRAAGITPSFDISDTSLGDPKSENR